MFYATLQPLLFTQKNIKINNPSINRYEGPVAVEILFDSTLQDTRPQTVISHVTEGTLRLPNNTNEPVHVAKSQDLTKLFLSYISNNSWNPTPFNTTIKIESISADMTIIFLHSTCNYFKNVTFCYLLMILQKFKLIL